MKVESGWLSSEDDRSQFWRLASSLLDRRVQPERVAIKVRGETADLFADDGGSRTMASLPEPQPNRFSARCRTLIDRVLLHRDPERFQLCYRLLWRLADNPALLDIASDKDVCRARDMAKAVRRDMHKMTAFVRFRAIDLAGDETIYVAWFEPDHHIVEAVAPFFRDRFASMKWSILTPKRSAHWDGRNLTLEAGAHFSDAPSQDPLEELWKTYYAHIFNPARLMTKAMKAHMPKKYWRNLPEAPLIEPMIASAQNRASSMIEAEPSVPARRIVRYSPDPPMSATGLAGELAKCTRCELHCHATQAVMGEGPFDAQLMIVGEQPGDEEDLAGRPFVGPAGRLLDIALQRTGIDRSRAYVTNAVKHFKYEARGKQRLHKSPNAGEIDHCRWWLEQEMELVRPTVTLALGVTAARSVLHQPVRLREIRSRPIELPLGLMVATFHPSFLLRLRDEAEKREKWDAFLSDLRQARALLSESARPRDRSEPVGNEPRGPSMSP